VLEKMRAEVEARPEAGFGAGGGPGTAQDHLVLAVVAGRAEVVVVLMYSAGGWP